jgi:meso-butanediol dehydrogenase/(S,S)-butanediol dehydrogenase/diacetyl reductase
MKKVAVVTASASVKAEGDFLAVEAAENTMIILSTPEVIVKMASMAGKHGKAPLLSDDVEHKFGVIGLTQAMTVELAAQDIRVKSICPGYVATPMQVRELTSEPNLRGAKAEEVKRLWIVDTPLDRLEEPEYVEKIVGSLTSEGAAFITGEAIAVNGRAFMN